jgi:protein gp37
MSTTSKIEWTGKTWNPSTGCDRISAGCDNCYALTLAKRLKGMGQAKYQNDGDPRTSGPGFGLTVHPDALDEPLHWRKSTKVFVNSMSDLFHARVPREFLAEVFAVMALAPQHEFQVLTKRPERAARILADLEFRTAVQYAALKRAGNAAPWLVEPWWPLRNVWMGTSIESDAYVRRADALRATPAAVRFISAEPLLDAPWSLDLTDIDWLIAGGESGPGARPMELDWARFLLELCEASGTAPFVKQLGTVWASGISSDRKGGDWDDWPTDLRVREYPHVAKAASR